jgi:uncharacterized membrane protein YidH (DUF202 family)
LNPPPASDGPAGQAATAGPARIEAADALDRTALSWTRSSLSIAASGVLIARAAFVAHLDVLGVACAIAIAALAYLTYRHGRTVYARRGQPGAFAHPHTATLGRLTAATVAIAVVAVVVTIAL